MIIFTYNDYLDCNLNYNLRKNIEIENKIINNYKIIKNYTKKRLNNEDLEERIDYLIEKNIGKKEEIVNILKDFLEGNNLDINVNNLEKIDDCKYKIKEREIFLFIKIQKKFNYHMPYIILEECMDFINQKKQDFNSKKFPIIVPIVLYTGKEEINIKKSAKLNYTSFNYNKVNLSYNLIDFSLYTNIQLMNKKSIIGRLMVIKRNIV